MVILSGGQEWLVRCSSPSSPLCIACNMRAIYSKCLYTQLWPLLHWTSYILILPGIEMTMQLNQPPRVTNVLVFQDHFMKHIMAYVTPNQTAKTVAKFLYQGYISIFGALARLLSDQGANFMSSIIDEMCMFLSVKKLQTIPYHLQTNKLVERSHQTIMQMIGKLGEDKKANWPGHLAEIVQAYNATWSATMGYSPHYLMIGHRPWIRSTFTSPPLGVQRSPLEVPLPSVWTNMWLLSVTDWGPPSRRLRPSQWQKPNDRNDTMTDR